MSPKICISCSHLPEGLEFEKENEINLVLLQITGSGVVTDLCLNPNAVYCSIFNLWSLFPIVNGDIHFVKGNQEDRIRMICTFLSPVLSTLST